MKIVAHKSLKDRFAAHEILMARETQTALPGTEMSLLDEMIVIQPEGAPMNLFGSYGDGTEYELIYDDEEEGQ
jgi:hypothetical protein